MLARCTDGDTEGTSRVLITTPWLPDCIRFESCVLANREHRAEGRLLRRA
jgi:hypothetical protein